MYNVKNILRLTIFIVNALPTATLSIFVLLLEAYTSRDRVSLLASASFAKRIVLTSSEIGADNN